MHKNLKVVALVPARGGSKGVPRKNLAKIGGSSLLERAISTGLGCQYVDEVVVSTDDHEMARAAADSGADVHVRDPAAATDTATADDVVRDFLASSGVARDKDNMFLVYLQPTSPFRTAVHLTEAFDTMDRADAVRCVSIVKELHTPFKSLRLSESGALQPLFDEKSVRSNRQALPDTYRPNGAIYIFTIKDFREHSGIPISGAVPYLMNDESSVDIDSARDIALAERIENERLTR